MRALKSMTGFIDGWIYSAANTDVLQNEEQEHAYVGWCTRNCGAMHGAKADGNFILHSLGNGLYIAGCQQK